MGAQAGYEKKKKTASRTYILARAQTALPFVGRET